MAKKYILTRDDVKNNLTSTDTNKPLSANQGKVLQETKQNTISSSNPLNADYVSDGTTNKVYTSDEKTKLEGIETDAQVNKIESIKADGTTLAITDKAVDIPVATENSAGLVKLQTSISTVYVSPNGSDVTGNGKYSNPWREISKAIEETKNKPVKFVNIECAGGEYSGFSISASKTPYPNYNLYSLDDVTINGKIYITNTDFNIQVSYQKTFTVNSSENIGIEIGTHGNFEVYGNGSINITSKRVGIYCVSPSRRIAFGCDNGVRITLTENNPYSGIEMYKNDYFSATDVVVNSNSGNGEAAVRGKDSSCIIIKSLTTNLTEYLLESGSVLAIGSHWVNQSGGGGGVWGQITGDINTQSDLTSFVNSKPTILSGTVEPTPDMGSVGDLYVRYDE